MVDVGDAPSGSRGAFREVAQLVERRLLRGGGRGFKSHPSGQRKEVAYVPGHDG